MNCLEHVNKKAKWECLNCGNTYCDKCSDEGMGECLACIPPDLVEIKK